MRKTPGSLHVATSLWLTTVRFLRRWRSRLRARLSVGRGRLCRALLWACPRTRAAFGRAVTATGFGLRLCRRRTGLGTGCRGLRRGGRGSGFAATTRTLGRGGFFRMLFVALTFCAASSFHGRAGRPHTSSMEQCNAQSTNCGQGCGAILPFFANSCRRIRYTAQFAYNLWDAYECIQTSQGYFPGFSRQIILATMHSIETNIIQHGRVAVAGTAMGHAVYVPGHHGRYSGHCRRG